MDEDGRSRSLGPVSDPSDQKLIEKSPQCCYRLQVIPVQMTTRDIYDFMSERKLGVLGTIGPENRPQSSLVGIAVTQELEIIFDTVKTSRKYGNLIARPNCSFAIGWVGEQTLQYEGKATEPVEKDLDRLHEIYFAAWPECRAHLSWRDIAYFVVRPRWFRFSDFDQNPPLIMEFTMDIDCGG